MISVCLRSAYATEADARQAISTMPAGTQYLGVWKVPTPEQPVVHVFTTHSGEELTRAGWTPVDREPGNDRA